MLKKILVVVMLLTIFLLAFTACESKCRNHTYTDECDAVCNNEDCGYTRVAPHKWSSVCDGKCDCGEVRTPASHVYDNACDATCNVCGGERTASEHIDSNNDGRCDSCGINLSTGAPVCQNHTYTDECDAVCNNEDCGYTRVAPHKWSSVCDGKCDCGEEREAQGHTYTDECDTVCNNDGCGYTREAPHKWSSACDSKCDCGEEREATSHTDTALPYGKCDVCGTSTDIADTEVFDGMQSVLLIGQSNMAGRGSLNRVESISSDKIFMWRDTGWVKMVEPIHTDKTSAGVGPGASFAKGFIDTFGNDVGLIPGTYGGSSLEDWAVGGELYNAALAMAKEAQKSSNICAILWHQGESDMNNSNYAAEFKVIMDSFIEDLGLEETKIVIITGELGEWRGTGVTTVHNALYSLSGYYTNYGVASAAGLINRPVYEQENDTGHFDAPSQRVLGYRYFNIFYNLVTGKTYTYDDNHNNYRKEIVAEEPEESDIDYIVYKNFDSLTAGVVSAVEGLSLNTRGAGFKAYLKSEGGTDKYLSVEFGDGTQTQFPYFDAAFSVESGSTVVIEATLRLSSDFSAVGELFKLVGTNGGASANLRLVWIDSDGKLYNMCGNTNAKGDYLGIHLDQFEWTTVRVVCNLKANTKEIYCNGTKLASSFAISDSATSGFTVNKARIMQVNTGKSPSATGALHLDEFKIYEDKSTSYLLNENFNSLTTGTVTSISGIALTPRNSEFKIGEKTDTADKYLSFECGTNTAASSTPYLDSSVSTDSVVVIEADLMLSENYNAEGDLLKVMGTSTLPLIYVGTDGTLYDMSSGSKGASLDVSLSKTEWTTVKVVCDFANNTKDVYVGGTLVGDKLALSSAGITNYSMTKLRVMQFKGSTNTGALYLDNYKICLQ